MNVMIREFFRSLKKNFARFLSILAIIALGVGFFAGINATRPDMVKSAAKYYDDHNLMDLRSLNPLGYSPEQIERLRSVKGVDQMQMSYTKDLFLVKGEVRMPVRTYSLDVAGSSPDLINQLIVQEGRLPEKSGEIVLAREDYVDIDLALGETVRFQEDEGNDISDVLKDQVYTVVGFVESPLYISFEMEYTNIGTGQLATFVYVPQEDFTLEEPSEFFFSVAGAKSYSPESAEYKTLVDGAKEEVDQLGKEIMAQETADLKAELEENRDTLNRERADAEQKIAQAEADLIQGQEDLEEARITLRDEEIKGREQIEDGREKIKDGRRELTKGRNELDEAKEELKDGRAQYEAGYRKWEKGREAYLDGKAQYDKGVKELARAKRELDSAKEQIDDGKAQIRRNEGRIEEAEEQIELFGRVVRGLNRARDFVPDGALISQAQYDEVVGEVKKVSPQTAAYILTFIPYTTPTAPRLLREFITTSLKPLNDSYRSAKASFEDGKAQLEAAKRQIAQGEKEYKKGLAQYNAGKAQLDDSKEQLSQARRQVEDGKEELDKSRRQLEDGEEELKKGEKQLADAKKELDQGEQDLTEGEETLEKELREAEEKIAEGEADLKTGREDFIREKADAEQKLADADAKLLDAERKILDIPDEWFVLTREGNPSYSSWFDNAEKIGKVATVFPFFFFLVAALVSLTTITRMVEEERTQAGTLKALGYGPAWISGKYIAYALLASVIGSAAGLVLGFNLFPRVIIEAYGMMYNIPASVIEFNPRYAGLSFGLAVISAVGAALAGIYSEIREKPASLMQPKAPPAGKRIVLERIRPLWRRLSFSKKVTFRNLFLYKKRFWMTVLGIAGCTALILIGFGIKDSVDAIIGNQFRELFIYDQMAAVDSKKPAAERDLHAILSAEGRIEAYSLAQSLNMKVHVPGSDRTYDANLVVPEKPEELSGFIVLRSRVGHAPLPLKDEGVIVSEKLADQLGLKPGGEISYEDSERRQFKAKVSGIAENYIDNYIYISPAYYEEVHVMRPDYTSAWIDLTEEGLTNEPLVQEALMEEDGVLGIISSAEISKTFNDQMASLIYVVLVLIASAGALAFIVLYNLSNVNITERVRELATIKVLGFRDGEVAAYVYRENIYLTLFGTVFGLGLGILMHRYIIDTMEIDNMMFGKTITPLSFLYAFALTFFFSAVVNFAMYFALKKINMVESLKSLE